MPEVRKENEDGVRPVQKGDDVSREKTCGTCEYADYHMPGARPRGTHVRCEVYSCQKEKESKGCSNWKERKKEAEK